MRALLGMVGEGGGVDGEPGGVVLAGDEGADGHAGREDRIGQVEIGQRPPHLAQFTEQGQPQHLSQMPRRRVTAVRPHP